MSAFLYIKHGHNLRAAGIPWRSDPAVFNCAKKINSGAAYLAAAQYYDEWARAETFRDAIPSLRYHALKLHVWYCKCAAEAW